jgi:membrane protease YdiL (CAAX protease family)
MAWEWILTGFVWLGIRKRFTLRDIIGGRWASFEEFFFDVVIAAGFWVIAALVLAGAAVLLRLDQGDKIETMRRQLGFLTPDTSLELAIWFCLSATAGFCEEFIFRGYLQLQFAALTRSMWLGALISAVVFGASHGYEGAPRMLLIGIFGFMFGLLAWWRRSLRPGMIAHAWHDALSGVMLQMLK